MRREAKANTDAAGNFLAISQEPMSEMGAADALVVDWLELPPVRVPAVTNACRICCTDDVTR